MAATQPDRGEGPADGARRPLAPHPVGLAVAIAVVTAVALSLAAGAPKKLPAAALGSEALLHVLRVSAMVAAFALIATVVVRAWAGELPIKLGGGGVEYAAKTEAVKDNVEQAVRDLTDTDTRLSAALLAETGRREALEQRVAQLEQRSS